MVGRWTRALQTPSRATAPWLLLLCLAFNTAAEPVEAPEQPWEGTQGSSNGTKAAPPDEAAASVTVDLSQRKPTSPLLYGVFFEEIGHAGDGGLYAELVQDRSFDAIAKATGFIEPWAAAGAQGAQQAPPSSGGNHSLRMPVSLAELAGEHIQRMGEPCSPQARGCGCSAGEWKSLKEHGPKACGAGDDIIVAWSALPGTTTTLSKELPLNERNLVAMELSPSAGPSSSSSSSSSSSGDGASSTVGIVNSGYWGIPVEAHTPLTLSLYLRTPHGRSAPTNVTVALLAAEGPSDGRTVASLPLAAAVISGITAEWQRFNAELVSGVTDRQAKLAVMFRGPGTLVVDSVSLFPSTNVARGREQGLVNPWPFRRDLMDALEALQPRFLRFPGGCYVEGDWLQGAFRWKTTVGRNEERPGHHNSMWGYWSTDGLGLFEYLLLAEELGAEPIWVVNNGIAHNDQVPASDVWPWIQEALDGIEFITGPPSSTWGSVRAAMGRPQPYALNYLAIGNEGCGLPWDRPNPNFKPHFWRNYLEFYGAIKAAYPHLRLIANCAELREYGPTEIWEYHVYTNPQDMFARRRAFDGADPQTGLVFASEYAVTDGGGQGNVIGAVAEAAFMLGLERNSHVVLAGSYAPLFVNANARPWPTNMLVFDNSRLYGIPSYHVQQMLSSHLGTANIHTEVAGAAGADSLAAATSCLDADCTQIAVKLVNFSPAEQRVSLRFQGMGSGALGPTAELLVLGSNQPLDENSFENPTKVSPRTNTFSGASESFELPVEPWSLTVVRLRVVPPAA